MDQGFDGLLLPPELLEAIHEYNCALTREERVAPYRRIVELTKGKETAFLVSLIQASIGLNLPMGLEKDSNRTPRDAASGATSPLPETAEKKDATRPTDNVTASVNPTTQGLSAPSVVGTGNQVIAPQHVHSEQRTHTGIGAAGIVAILVAVASIVAAVIYAMQGSRPARVEHKPSVEDVARPEPALSSAAPSGKTAPPADPCTVWLKAWRTAGELRGGISPENRVIRHLRVGTLEALDLRLDPELEVKRDALVARMKQASSVSSNDGADSRYDLPYDTDFEATEVAIVRGIRDYALDCGVATDWTGFTLREP